MLMAKAVEGAATRVEGKKQIAVASFAVALRQLPTILADNAGLDSSDLIARLRKTIYDGMSTYGLDLMTPGGGIADMRDLGVKLQAQEGGSIFRKRSRRGKNYSLWMAVFRLT